MSTIPKAILKRAQQIKLVIFDVDGVLSDGTLYYYDAELESKGFHVHDGIGIVALQQMGLHVGIITKRCSPLLSKRMSQLGIQHLYEGQEDKRIAYHELRAKLALQDEQIAYVGDDIVDLPVMRQVGLSIAVANAIDYVAEHAHWQTTRCGGHGAAREVCDLILTAQGLLPKLLERYLT